MSVDPAKKNVVSVSDWIRAEWQHVRIKLLLLNLLLLVLVMASALGVIYSTYKSRQLFSKLEQLNRDTTKLEEDRGRLLLEQSTWDSNSRIERIAKSELHMVVPDANDIVVVEQ